MQSNSKGYKLIKIGSIVLILYVLIGGLFLPLKTGITGVSNGQLKSNEPQSFSVDLYNPGTGFVAEKVILKHKNLVFQSQENQYNEAGYLNSKINVVLGDTQHSQLFDVFVFGSSSVSPKQWMYFPDAVWVEKSISDTGVSNKIELSNLTSLVKQDIQSGFPNRPILNESIRNLLYHVPMWFSMMFLLLLSVIYAIKYLMKNQLKDDLWSESFIKIALLNGILGCVTGSSWASITWESWWPSDDPKLNGVAIGMFMYLAYLILRTSLKDPYQRARISSVYAILIYPIFMALIAIMPKLSADTLHPGSGGTVGFNKYDLDNTLRLFFYPAVIGWILFFIWISILRYRFETLKNIQIEREDNE